MRREVLMPAMGWMASGVISIAAWSRESARLYCSTCQNHAGLLYIGVFVIIVGIMLLLFNARIGKIIDYYKGRQHSSKKEGQP